MNCVYDLSKYPANFNFVEFLSASVAYGADRVIFKNSKNVRKKFGPDETAERIRSILEPCCELMGVAHEFSEGTGIDPGYHIGVTIKAYRDTGRIGKFKSQKAGNARFTVTLRNSKRYPQRNSTPDFERFAKEIGAAVIPDYADKRMPLAEKLALYAGAEMNYFSPNGVGAMCWASDYPYRLFMYGVDADYHAKQEFPVGSQFPWAGNNQRVIWKSPTFDELMEAHGFR